MTNARGTQTLTRAGIALLVGLAFSAGATPAFAKDAKDGRGMLDDTVTVKETAASRATCANPKLSSPLLPFNDSRSYFTAPGGDFEGPAAEGWQLSGGAEVAAGSHSFDALGSDNDFSLSLPAGAAATSPEFCVDLHYPTFRFMMAQVAAGGDGELAVDVIYPDLRDNNAREAKRFTTSASDGWGLTGDVELEPERAGAAAGWRYVALRFRSTAKKKAVSEYRVDNILIDPRHYG